MRRVLFALVAVGGLIGLSACSVPNPDITFYSSGRSVTAAPIQYCDVREEHCAADGSAAASLTVIPGQPVQISVPQEVANTPWQVGARFRDASGSEYASCSPLFSVGQRYAYTVYAPHAGDQLVLIEIYQSSGTLAMTPDNQVYMPIRGTWVLTANTQGAAANTVLPKPGDNLCANS
ncbi:MAG TPA: DUF2771 family protein [Pseudonocardiaceae bacterium]|nr:DUF2771 family protein [Pseudonocardiaceae bacterium]